MKDPRSSPSPSSIGESEPNPVVPKHLSDKQPLSLPTLRAGSAEFVPRAQSADNLASIDSIDAVPGSEHGAPDDSPLYVE